MSIKNTSIFFEHYLDVPLKVWPCSHFTPKEIANKGDGSILVNFNALNALEKLRNLLGEPVVILSAFRDIGHNKKVGGAKNSRHLIGEAFDIKLKNPRDYTKILVAAINAGFTGFGFYENFLHIDMGRPRAWYR